MTLATTVYATGIYPVASNLTLGGRCRFDEGAILQPAAGVTVTFANAYIDASDFQQIFDLSQGGAVAGSIINEYHAGAWFGADYTGGSVTGANVQAAFSSALTPVVKLPRGTYDCTGTQLSLVDRHLICETYRSGCAADAVTLKWTADMGAGTAALSVYSSSSSLSSAKYRGFNIAGPGQGGAPVGSVGCQMDGIIFGNGGNHKFDARDICVTGVRFPYTAWCNNGHSTLENVGGSGNYATWCMLSTGGDWKWTNCFSNAELRAAFYVPKNGGMGVHADLDGYFCGYTPYLVYQSSTPEARLPGTATSGLTVASVWKRVACERLGNAFINLVPVDSSLYQLKLIASGWDALQGSAVPIVSEAQDYAIKVGYIEGLDLNDALDAAGAGTLAPFKAGVIQVQNSNSRGISACRLHNLNGAGTTFLSGTVRARIIPQTYNLPVLSFPAGMTQVSYTASDCESCSRGNWFPVARCAQSLGAVTAMLTTSGNVVTITLSAALAYAVSFTVNLYGPGT